jgi:hypothetical protein
MLFGGGEHFTVCQSEAHPRQKQPLFTPTSTPAVAPPKRGITAIESCPGYGILGHD